MLVVMVNLQFKNLKIVGNVFLAHTTIQECNLKTMLPHDLHVYYHLNHYNM